MALVTASCVIRSDALTRKFPTVRSAFTHSRNMIADAGLNFICTK